MSTTNMASSSSGYWEDLRKQARQLENELDLKMVSFSKLCTSYTSGNTGLGINQRARDRSDSTGSSHDNLMVAMTTEIEQLLAKLASVNGKMAEFTAGALPHNAALMHTLQRHRDILQDYTNEFHKTKTNFFSLREREDLLGSVHRDIESYKSGSGVNNRRTELSLKEHEHLRKTKEDHTHRPQMNKGDVAVAELYTRCPTCYWKKSSTCSDRLIDNAISIAMATKENMTFQRGVLKSIQTRVTTLANRFPAINSLIQKINLRKRRDSLILGTVIGVCTILLLLYTFH